MYLLLVLFTVFRMFFCVFVGRRRVSSFYENNIYMDIRDGYINFVKCF